MAHIHEKIDWTVSVFIVHQKKVLLRMHEKYHTLLAVGGHIEHDEDPLTAAKRECLEEVGLSIVIPGEEIAQPFLTDRFHLRILPRPAYMNIHAISSTHQHIDIIYYATSDSMEVTPEHPDDSWEWLTASEIQKRDDIIGTIKYYACGALDALCG
jgi:8-oxo-dGTP diphosphatase